MNQLYVTRNPWNSVCPRNKPKEFIVQVNPKLYQVTSFVTYESFEDNTKTLMIIGNFQKDVSIFVCCCRYNIVYTHWLNRCLDSVTQCVTFY